ncbi:MAG: VOC family protein [Candidatus Levybacteria bacterium]|nr:VOC family protein [Candidatus Levybacteria bacterium]
MLNFNSVMIGTHQPKILAEFYKKVFDRKADWEDGGWYGWQVGTTNITIGEHSEVKGSSKEPQRILLNFETKEVKKEFDRIKKTDAKVVKEPYEPGEAKGMWIATFADPDGNYFQLMTPWESNN